MKYRKFFRELLKKECKGHKGLKRAVKRLGFRPTIHNQSMLAMGMYKEMR